MTDSKELTGNYTLLERVPFWPEGLAIKPSAEVKNSVLYNAGAFPWDRDEIDERIILEVKTEKGRIIDSETKVGGYPHIEPVYRKFVENEWDLQSLTKKQ